MTPTFRLEIPSLVYEDLMRQAIEERPNECCGFLAGTIADGVGRVVRRYPLVNDAASPIRYRADERSLFAAHRACRDAGLEFLAVYHSHPTSEPIPSRTDLAEHYWDGLMTLIVSLCDDPPRMRGWWLTNEDYREGDWVVVGRE